MNTKITHRILQMLAAVLGLLVSSPLLAQETSPTQVLFIGNSYTHYNNMPELFQKIAESRGENVIAEMDARSGHSFQMHSRRPELFEHIKARKWDYVVMQGFSREFSFSKDYMDTASVPYFEMILDSIYANNPCTKVLLYMTWGYRTGFAEREDIDSYEKMRTAVKSGYQYIANRYKLAIVPVGDVYEKIRTTGDGSLFHCLYQQDDQHPTITGSYAIANTFYSAIFRNTPLGGYHKGITKEDAEFIQRTSYDYVSAHMNENALDKEYFEIKYDWSDRGNLIVRAQAHYSTSNVVWDFGDGTVVKSSVVEHEYNQVASYPISLAIQARCGSHSFMQAVNLEQLPQPAKDHPFAAQIARSIKKAKKKQRKAG